MIRSEAFSRHRKLGNYGRATWHGSMALLDSFGFDLYGNTASETATNVAISMVIGAALSKLTAAGHASQLNVQGSKEMLASRVAARKIQTNSPTETPSTTVPLQSNNARSVGPMVLESSGASPRGNQFVSATAQTPRSTITSILADIAESEAYKAALLRGEIGLQRPQGANVPGVDFITARLLNAQGVMEIIVTDVKMSTVGRFPVQQGRTVPRSWMSEVQSAVSSNRLNLNNPVLEQQIQAAFSAGRVRLRQLNSDHSPRGQGQISGF